MGDHNSIWSDNVHEIVEIGEKKFSFFCDSTCILCTMCSNLAPENFRISENGDHDICFKQPENDEELEECQTALENCPVGAIGDNGYDREEALIEALPLGARFAPSRYSGDGKLTNPSMKPTTERDNLGSTTKKTAWAKIKNWLK